MAQSSNIEKVARNARVFKEKLEVLGCPYTDGVEESWVLDLLYKPGEHRIRLLQWLFSKFDSRLHDLLDPQYVSLESKMDSRIQRLLYVASSLGLCSPDDAELIRGTGSLHRQTVFIEQLLDLVYIMDQSENLHMKSMQSPGLVGGTSLSDQFSNDCRFVDALAEQENIENVFMSDAKLLPPDITKQLNINRREKEERGETAELAVPDMSEMEATAAHYAKELQKQQEILEDLKKMYEFPKDDPQNIENMQKKLRLALSELSQLIIGFCYCFENEIQQWCNKTPPQLSQLGPAFKRIHGLLEHFNTMLKSTDKIHSVHDNLCTNLPKKVQKITEEQGSSMGDHVLAMIKDFQDHVSILEDSLSRSEKSSTTKTSFKLSHIPTLN